MKYSYYLMLFFLSIFTSCGQKLYEKGDYTFYKKSFVLKNNLVLKTNGVYVLDHIWTKDNGGTAKEPKEHRFYKFYDTGQSNLFLDTDNTIKTDQDYTDAIKNDNRRKSETLFEGYYKLEGERIIIQSMVVPRRQFEYKYGYVENNTLVIVKATHEGNGKFDDKYFTDYYKEYYIFKPLQEVDAVIPKW